MVAFQGRALKLETVHKVTFPSKCHVFLEKSFFHLRNVFCHRAVSSLQTDLLQQELPEKVPRESGASLPHVLQTPSCKGAVWAASPSLRFAADPRAPSQQGTREIWTRSISSSTHRHPKAKGRGQPSTSPRDPSTQGGAGARPRQHPACGAEAPVLTAPSPPAAPHSPALKPCRGWRQRWGWKGWMALKLRER